ncbi:MAG: DUF2911 domain-containing protein [Gemmatimonadaceae bacterium]
MTSHNRRILAAPALIAVFALPAGAQVIRPSQPGAVMQWVANTKIEISYHRPVARGRELFGKLVPYGKIWSPSADTAATVTISTPITINGSPLAKGSYSMWAIPGATEWTLIFSSVPVVHHMFYPEGKDVLRVKAVPRQGDRMETLTIYFPMVDADSAEMVLHWGTTVVPLSIKSKK